jgi:hypothetical protein
MRVLEGVGDRFLADVQEVLFQRRRQRLGGAVLAHLQGHGSIRNQLPRRLVQGRSQAAAFERRRA